MSKPEPPPLPRNTPPIPPLTGPASASSVYEYVMSFEKPLTQDEKTAWLMVIVHYIQSGLLPESIYPVLCNRIASLPEVFPAQNRPPEKIPGSDYVHAGPPKPYQVLLKMYEGNKPTHFPDTSVAILRTKPQSDGNSLAVLICAVLLIVLGLIVYGVGSSYMKTSQKEEKASARIVPAPPETKPVVLEVQTDNPFENNSMTIGKEVLRITLKLSETEKCFYKIERTTVPLSESFEGQAVDLFPNTKSWQGNEGQITTIYDFKKYDNLDGIFQQSKQPQDKVSLDKSSGHLLMNVGPAAWSKGTCGIRFPKRSMLPVEIIADIDTLEYFEQGNDLYPTEMRISFEGIESFIFFYTPHSAKVFGCWLKGDSSQDIFHNTGDNDRIEGTYDFPIKNISYPFSIAIGIVD